MAKVLVVGARGVPYVEGGAEKNAEMIFPLIADQGYEVTLCGLSRHITAKEFKKVQLKKGPTFSFLRTDKLFYYVHCLYWAIRIRPDVVHLQGLGAAFFLWAYKLMGIKVVARYGSADYILNKWGLLGRAGFRFSEWQLRYADAVISVAPSLTMRLAERGIAKNVFTIPNALDLPDETPEPSDGHLAYDFNQPFVLTVGRITSQKNIETLMEGFARFKARTGAPHKLLFIGGLDDAHYAAKVKALATDDMLFLGRIPRNELEHYYRACSAYISASLHEGHSNAIMEAISHHCPLVLSAIAENKDMPLDDGHYFDQSNPDAISQAIENCLNAPGDFRVDTTHFSTWPEIAARTVQVYETTGVAVDSSQNKVLKFAE